MTKIELFMTNFKIFIRYYRYNKYYFFLSYYENLHYAPTYNICYFIIQNYFIIFHPYIK